MCNVLLKNAEDLLSVTFVNVITSIGNFKGQSSVKTWLYSIARNVMVSGVTPFDIESGQLVSLLKQAEEYEDNVIIEKGDTKEEIKERISVFIKDKQK